jgi:RHS repeat-associated protein
MRGHLIGPKSRGVSVLSRLALVAVLLFTTLGMAPAAAGVASSLSPVPTQSWTVPPGQAKKLSYDGATLDINNKALDKTTTISIGSLSDLHVADLDQGMANLTRGPRKGYRFLPHMGFKSQIKVVMPYDRSQLPEGMTEEEIRAYYFDEQLGTWQELERVGLNTRTQEITSYTDHFTDMIVATISVPDHPQPLSNNPNSMKDIKAANPAAAINVIPAPAASPRGDANLSYPIEVPEGRDGVQPQLNIGYNSGGANGWLGLGWDLQTFSIGIDSRWGVPRYDPDKETETYMLNGEMLAPVAHRDELQDRSAEKVFHTRVEGKFQKIVRHGAGPNAYWWEVTDKNGMRYFYGGTPEQPGGVDPAAVLADPSPSANIFRWMLREMRDANGNTMRYDYDVVNGGGGAEEPWRQIYLSRIRYTGRAGAGQGPYEVVFQREGGRPDVMVDGRPGFKTVLTDRLTRIDVRLEQNGQTQLVRRYNLSYTTGQFDKTLLERIVQLGEDGATELARHSFEYFDEVTGPVPNQQQGFLNGGTITGATNISGSGILLTGVDSSSLQADQTSSWEAQGSLGVSFLGIIGVGGRAGGGASDTVTRLTLVDLNGDNLPDQVYEQGGQIRYRPNTGGPGNNVNFGNPVDLPTLTTIAKEHSSTFSYGGTVTILVSISGEKVSTTTRGEIYLADVNGDLLPDLVDRGKVYYNRLENGVPVWKPDNPVPVVAGAAANTQGMVQPPDDREEIEKNFYLVDPIRRWVAPYSGVVSIQGAVHLLAAPPTDYSTADGVRATIQHNASEIWSTTIADPTDLGDKPITGLDSVPVSAGDRLYFRVNSIYDGAYDAVSFDPTITYSEVNGGPVDTAAVDENGMPLFVYQPSADDAYGGRPVIFQLPFTGEAMLAGNLVKSAVTSDDITLEVRKGPGLALVHEQTFQWDQVGSFPVQLALNTAEGESLQVFIRADTRVDLTAIEFLPTLVYSTVGGQPAPTLPGGEPALPAFRPPASMQVYPRSASTNPYAPYVATETGKLHVEWSVSAVNFPPLGLSADLMLSVKRAGQAPVKQKVSVVNDAVVFPWSLSADIDVNQGDELYFTVDTPTHETLARFFDVITINPPSITYPDLGVPAASAPYALHLGLAHDEAFGGGFRSWWTGQYNADFGRAEADGLASTCADGIDNDNDGATDLDDPTCRLPIFENRLRVPTSDDDPILDQFLLMVPYTEWDTGIDHWQAQEKDAWIRGGDMSPSRLGPAKFLDFWGGSLGGPRGVIRLGGSKTTSGELSFLVFGGGVADGTNWSDVDFFDVNGDMYPDVVGNGKVQATYPNGALQDGHTNLGVFSRVRESTSWTESISIGAAVPLIRSDAEGDAQSIDTNQSELTISAGASGARGEYDSRWDQMDLNGDGLPDYVRQVAGGLQVRLNLGYRFAEPETWSTSGKLSHQDALLAGLSLGLGFSTPSFGLGGGVSLTQSSVAAPELLTDVNGDGLTDLISKAVVEGLDGLTPTHVSTGTVLTVQLNTGNGFTAPRLLTGALGRPVSHNIMIARSVSAQGNVTVPIGPVFVSIGGGYAQSSALGGARTNMTDLDGDGYNDHVYSDTAGNVSVQFNAHGRTNLLKKIHRPLGASMDLDYERSGNTTEQPQSRWVLTRVALSDGVAGDGGDKLTTFKYENGRYDRVERDFYGFGRVVQEERDPAQPSVVDRATVREYHTDSFYTAGLLKRQIVQTGAGQRFVEEEHTYVLHDVLTSAEPADGSSTTATIFPQLARTDRRFYEGNAAPGKTTYVTNSYDAFGNVTQFFDAGDPGAADDLTAAIEYEHCLAPYIVDKAKSIVVTGSGAELRRREATIDCATGNETQIRQFLANGQVAVTDLSYFDNGMLKQVVEPANHKGQRYTLDYEYDPVIGQFITKITDIFGYSSSAAYHPKFGKPTSTTDLNGNTTTYTYDGFGRTTTITGPYEQGGATPTFRFEYHPEAAVPWARTRHLDPFRDMADPIDTVVFMDGEQRVLQTKKDGTVFTGPDSAAQDVMLVTGRVKFDFFGRAIEQFYPVTEPLGTPGVFNATFDAQAPARTEYDILDRETKQTFPDGTVELHAYGFGPDRAGVTQFETRVIDQNGVESREYHDVREQLVGIKQFNNGGGQTIWTSYGYDALKQLTEIRDDHDNVTRITYDKLGRQVAVESPDSGKTEFEFDPANNLVGRITANLAAQGAGVKISYEYDFNRPVSIKYPNYPGNNVTYEYGAPGAGDNRANRVTKVTSQAGSEERFYGKLGEVVKEINTIATFVPGSGAPVYTTEYLYDTWGRLQTLLYPDGEVLTYQYDSGGLVRAASGVKGGVNYDYLRRLEYDKFEHRAFVESGNGVRTEYSYRPDNLRLANLKSGVAGGAPFQNLNYAYDPVGNVLGLANDVPVPAPSQFGGPTNQSFAYDDLYRLTSASGTFQYAPDKTNQYSLSMAYDTIDNILSKQQTTDVVQPGGTVIPKMKTSYAWTYEYGSAKPHATTHLDERTFQYDANGNQLGWTNDKNGTRRNIVWDEENRVQSISDNGREQAFKYDHDGQRVIKRGKQGETVYANQFYTVRNKSTASKHIFVGEMRLLSKLVKQNAEEKDRYFYHPDHLGSSNFVTAADGSLFEHMEYFPFGETWVQEASNTQRTPYLFSGKELDEETGLYYYGARYYDPRQSQFVSVDPLMTSQPDNARLMPSLLSVYTYANQNPLRFVDPDGAAPKEISTPLPADAVVAKKTGIATATVGGIKVTIKPDTHTKAKSMRKKAVTKFSYTPKMPKAKFNKKGKVVSFSSAGANVTIWTVYGPKADPNMDSGYGRGTTDEDRAAGNTSLRFHEGSHGTDYLEYMENNPLPEFEGEEGMTKKQFQKAQREYNKALKEHFREMGKQSHENTDCVGDPPARGC